jgi:hypothetical protein
MKAVQLRKISVTVFPAVTGSPLEPEKSRAARAGLLHAKSQSYIEEDKNEAGSLGVPHFKRRPKGCCPKIKIASRPEAPPSLIPNQSGRRLAALQQSSGEG